MDEAATAAALQQAAWINQRLQLVCLAKRRKKEMEDKCQRVSVCVCERERVCVSVCVCVCVLDVGEKLESEYVGVKDSKL